MQLWACGFNAWGQLDFANSGSLSSDGMPEQHFMPTDLKHFECVLSGKEINVLRTSLSATLVRSSSELLEAGSPDQFFRYLQSKDCQIPFEHIAQTNSEKVAVIKSDNISTYDSLDQCKADIAAKTTTIGDVTNIVANDTSFYALTKSGKVFSWGDVRHESSLGREVTEECPADTPGLIEDLATDPITGIIKISAGGYVAGALTNDNDLYVWGGRQGQEPLLPDMGRTPESVDIDGEDILDFAVGDKHLVVLSMSHRLWVIGSFNEQGDESAQKKWKEITLPLEKGQKVVKVYAGYRTSFALVDDENAEKEE